MGQMQLDFPMYGQLRNQVLSVGDQSADLTYGLFGTYSLFENYPRMLLVRLGVGVTFRTRGFSSAVPFSSEITLSPVGAGLTASLGFFGTKSLSTDSSLNLDDQFTFSGQINPELLQVRGRLGYQVSDRVMISFGILHALSGKNAPEGTSYQCQFSWRGGLTPNLKVVQDFPSAVLEAKVLKVNHRFSVLQINAGQSLGIKKGQSFEILKRTLNGRDQLVALALVVGVRDEQAALEVSDWILEEELSTSLIARLSGGF